MKPDDPAVFISMVIATLGRSNELEALMASLSALGRRDIEIIVVDQNADDRIVPVLAAWQNDLRIIHLRTAAAGVCRARNIGAAHASGQWLLFPDDDCWYPSDVLCRFEAIRQRHPAEFYCGRAVDVDGRTIMGRFEVQPGPIVRGNVWNTLIEWMLFVHRDTFAKVGGFDEKIGPGAGTPWGAYEVQDLVLKLLGSGTRGHYDPELIGRHPDERAAPLSFEGAKKMRRYGAGLGYVMRKHGYSFLDYLPYLLRPLAGMAVYMASGRLLLARRSREILIGRWSGWRSAPDTGMLS